MSLYKCLLYLILAYIVCVLPLGRASGQGRERNNNPRLIVLTDVSAFLHAEGEPDDSQSLIRLMLYTNEIEVEGLIATSNLGHGQRTRPELIRKVVEMYGEVQPNLLLHDKNYPPASKLSAVIKSGTPIASPNVPVDQSIGEGKDTEGSEWIIKVADKKDQRPVWVAIFGGSADLAQALWRVRATRSPEEVKQFISKLRVHTVYDQDKTGPWIRAEFPELFVIFRHHGIRGMYRGGDTTLVRSRWVETNIRNDHGPLGALYTNYRGGDIWGRRLGRVYGIKEGDTPSFLYLINNGLNVPAHPELGSWSGRFRKDTAGDNLWVEAVDSVGEYRTDPDPRMAAIYRWRPAWQADFAARLDWCVKPYRQANHAPQRKTTKKKDLVVSAGEQVKLIAPKASDPDGNGLKYHWYFYPEEGTYQGVFPRMTSSENAAIFAAPQVTSRQAMHVMLEVTDNGQPSLTSYKRFIVWVNPQTNIR